MISLRKALNGEAPGGSRRNVLRRKQRQSNRGLKQSNARQKSRPEKIFNYGNEPKRKELKSGAKQQKPHDTSGWLQKVRRGKMLVNKLSKRKPRTYVGS